ncbi:MAG: hypothetical protein ABSG67_14375 [Thermoguttaceae bacterium]
MSSPEDKKIDFEKLTLSEDLSGSLEPLANGAGERPLSEQKLELEEKEEAAPATEQEIAEQEELVGREGPPAPAKSKLKAFIDKLSVADPFNVMLAIAVAALLIAILCCLVELGRYGFHISAKQARSTVTMSDGVDISRPNG